jgi:hypothetical protein
MIQKKVQDNESKAIDILGGHEPLRAIVEAGELTDKQYKLLYPIFQMEMPYGTQKARTGDPIIWIMNRMEDIASRLIPYEEDKKL